MRRDGGPRHPGEGRDPVARRVNHVRTVAALATLLAHPLVRRLRAENAVRRLVTRASAGVQVREDTHFELSRAMPPVRHAVLEAGRRLAAAQLIDTADDVWFLTWPQLPALSDPGATPSGGAALRASVERRKAA